jgi:hypothetical protein
VEYKDLSSRKQMLAELRAVEKQVGVEELMAIMGNHGFKTTSGMSDGALAEVLSELKDRQSAIEAEKPKGKAAKKNPLDDSGMAPEWQEARKKFFATVKERIGNIDHHLIIGKDASLHDISAEDIDKMTVMVEAGEFDQLKK